MNACVFCEIAAGKSPAKHKGRWISTIIFEPLNPVTPGHLLVAPRQHVTDALEDSSITATTMADAVECVSWLRRAKPEYESVNFITSVGVPATQSVFHLHIHIVPRRDGDGLALPWTGQER
ncbi:histidine triad nucleotide binding protein [Microbacterium phage Phinky]|nr:histidine triad nucleotide binding protein [Microbacterium phage Phinky]